MKKKKKKKKTTPGQQRPGSVDPGVCSRLIGEANLSSKGKRSGKNCEVVAFLSWEGLTAITSGLHLEQRPAVTTWTNITGSGSGIFVVILF